MHKKSERRPEYRIVADLVKKEGKPHDCPACKATDIPGHLMRGRLEDGVVTWQCQRCHLDALKVAREAAKSSSTYCDWCCEAFLLEKGIPESSTVGPLCGADCQEACNGAARRRFIENWQATAELHAETRMTA